MVAGEGVRALAGPARLGQGVVQQRELRPPGLVVHLAVVDRHHPAGGGREDGPAEREEPVHRFGGQQRAPVPAGRRAPAPHGDEVHGVGRGEQVGAVARHPPRRAVAREPGAAERQREDDGVGSGHMANRTERSAGAGMDGWAGRVAEGAVRRRRDGGGWRRRGRGVGGKAGRDDDRRDHGTAQQQRRADQHGVAVDRVPGRPASVRLPVPRPAASGRTATASRPAARATALLTPLATPACALVDRAERGGGQRRDGQRQAEAEHDHRGQDVERGTTRPRRCGPAAAARRRR